MNAPMHTAGALATSGNGACGRVPMIFSAYGVPARSSAAQIIEKAAKICAIINKNSREMIQKLAKMVQKIVII